MDCAFAGAADTFHTATKSVPVKVDHLGLIVERKLVLLCM